MLSMSANAQTTVNLEAYDIRSHVFTAYVNDTVGAKVSAVTIALNVENMSSGHLDWYSVSGWYQREGLDQPRIPLVGIYTGNLTLYHFDNEALIDSIVKFGYDDYNRYGFMDMMERYHNMDGYLEKITIGRTGRTVNSGLFEGEWTDGKTTRPMEANMSSLGVLQHQSVLHIDHNGQEIRVSINDLGMPLPQVYPGEHTVKGYKVVDDKLRIILSYDRSSKGYVLGMCGAGTETGFLWLELDEKGRLLGLEDYLIGSCLLNVDSKPGYQDEHEENYIVTDGDGIGWYLTFFRDTMTLEWEPGG